jgi:hypothetical protein
MRSWHGPGRAPPRGQLNSPAAGPSGVYGAYPGEFTEAGLSITAQYGSTGLSRVGGDDQVVCAAGRTGSADMGEQAPAASRVQPRLALPDWEILVSAFW